MSESQPLVSVVMPARNEARHVSEAIASVLAQSYRNLELIVIDDGSTDGTADLVAAAASRDDRVRLLSGPARGISAALNDGVAEAAGTWIARMDADDLCLPYRLARQLAAAAQTPEVVAWGSWAYLFVDGRTERQLVGKVGPITLDELASARRSCIPIGLLHPSVMMRRDVLEEVGGYDSRFDGGEDIELFDRMAEYGPVLSIPEPLLSMRLRTDGYGTVAFDKGRQAYRFVQARMQARKAGVRVPNIETFRLAEAEAGWGARLVRRARSHGAWAVWKSDVELLRGRYVRAVLLKLGAVLLDVHAARRLLGRLFARRLAASQPPRSTGPDRQTAE
ncbi:MAG: glycosyltransferase [Acidimicrobiia bacterium]